MKFASIDASRDRDIDKPSRIKVYLLFATATSVSDTYVFPWNLWLRWKKLPAVNVNFVKKKKKKKAKPSLFIFYRVVVGNNRRREGEVAREKKFTGEPGECTIKFIITPGSMCRLAKGRVEGNGSTLSDGRKIYSLTGDKRVARHQGINKFRTTGCRTFCSSSIGISIRGHRSIRVALFLSHRQLSQPIYIIVHIKNA